MAMLVIAGVVSGSLLVYDILDMRRKRCNGKAEFREKIRKMEDGEPETESY